MFKIMHTILAAVGEGVFKIIHTILAAVLEEGVARRAAFNPAAMEDNVTKPDQWTPPATVEGAQVFLLRRVVTSGPNQGVCFIQNENVSVINLQCGWGCR